jgi:hypothetical protein
VRTGRDADEDLFAGPFPAARRGVVAGEDTVGVGEQRGEPVRVAAGPTGQVVLRVSACSRCNWRAR